MDNYLNKILDDRYEIQAVIGQGGMAVVYRANDRKLNRAVAIKILKPEIREDEELRRRFRAESEAMAQLNHPNIINVFDVSAGDDLDYFVMELIDGITLKQYMNQRGVLTVKEAIHFTVQILKGLEHAHAKKIVHRDIKPQNVMILRDGTVKVTDFGIARVAEGQTIANGNAFGTVHYIAPEQARCEETDGRADLYSVGVILYEMLTGQLPFQGDSAVAVAMQHISSRARPPRELNPDIPVALELIVMKAMNSDKQKRYRVAGEMIDDLDGFRRDPAGFMPAVESSGLVQEGDTVRFVPIPHHREETLPSEVSHSRRLPAEREPKAPRSATKTATRSSFNLQPVLAGLLMLALLAGACILLWITILSPGESATDVLVPRLIGRQYDEVLKDKSLPKLVYAKAAEEYSDEFAAGEIIEQSEPEGKRVKEGSTLELTVSLGVQIETMPNYINWEYKEAEQNLRSLMNNSVRIIINLEASNTVERDLIIRTDPIPGQTVTAGQEVIFYVSGGPQLETVAMPNLLEKTEQEARSIIIELGLGIGEVTYEENSNYPPGVVINQSTPANREVPLNTEIHLTISVAPPETTTETEENVSTPPETLPPVSMSWTTLLPQDVEYPAEYLVEIYQDGGLIYRETVPKSQGSLSLAVTGRGTVTLDVFIEGSKWKTQTLTLE
jgi:serine/threonine protein kinase